MIRITWITPQNLGTLVNGQISYFGVRATASNGATLSYSLLGTSTFPNCLYFDSSTGNLVGRVSYQPSSNTTSATLSYSFTVRASAGGVILDRTFTFTIDKSI